jgi:hypothetical protein
MSRVRDCSIYELKKIYWKEKQKENTKTSLVNFGCFRISFISLRQKSEMKMRVIYRDSKRG